MKCDRCKGFIDGIQNRHRREVVSAEGICDQLNVCEACAREIDKSNRPVRIVLASFALTLVLTMGLLAWTGQWPPELPGWLQRSKSASSSSDGSRPVQPGSVDQFVVTVAATEMRSAAATDAAAVGSIPAGYKLRILERNGDWLKVAGADDSSVTGYIPAPGVL